MAPAIDRTAEGIRRDEEEDVAAIELDRAGRADDVDERDEPLKRVGRGERRVHLRRDLEAHRCANDDGVEGVLDAVAVGVPRSVRGAAVGR
jgi:hypothetical protein